MEDVLDFSFWYPQKQPTNQPTATKQTPNIVNKWKSEWMKWKEQV